MLLASLAPRRRALVLGVVALVLVLAGAAAVGALTGRRSTPAPQAMPGPVVLVPGYGGSPAGLQTLAQRLRREGRQVEFVALPDRGVGDLRRAAEALDEVVTRLEDGGAPSVDVVGYSAGGVTARVWVRAHDGARRARRIVTLGSPHHGTTLAAAADAALGGCDEQCEQLQPGSSLLAQLNRGDETPDGPVWVSVWTEVDETVVPPDSGRLADAIDVRLQDVCPRSRVSHGALPRDPAVVGIVVAALGPAEPVAPRKGDCERYAAAA
ncbi:MAG: lipase [Actinomycetota bacterium]|nr:lipase [Actinomycetota bacterium]